MAKAGQGQAGADGLSGRETAQTGGFSSGLGSLTAPTGQLVLRAWGLGRSIGPTQRLCMLSVCACGPPDPCRLLSQWVRCVLTKGDSVIHGPQASQSQEWQSQEPSPALLHHRDPPLSPERDRKTLQQKPCTACVLNLGGARMRKKLLERGNRAGVSFDQHESSQVPVPSLLLSKRA